MCITWQQCRSTRTVAYTQCTQKDLGIYITDSLKPNQFFHYYICIQVIRIPMIAHETDPPRTTYKVKRDMHYN